MPVMSTPDTPALLRYVARLQIAHHIPGRIRLKLSGPVDDELFALAQDAKRFGEALAGMNGVRSIGLKLGARSCVVEYDPSLIPPSAWNGLLSDVTTPEGEALQRRLSDLVPT